MILEFPHFRLLAFELPLCILLNLFLLLPLETDPIEEFKLSFLLFEFGVESGSHVLEVPHNLHAFFDLSLRLIIVSGELDVLLGNGDVASAVVKVERP